MIKRQCKAFELEPPFSSTHFNIKTIFKSVYPGLPGFYGMDAAYKTIMDQPLEGIHHRGGDDAKNIA